MYVPDAPHQQSLLTEALGFLSMADIVTKCGFQREHNLYKWWISTAIFVCVLCPKSAIFVEIDINYKHEGVKYKVKRDFAF